MGPNNVAPYWRVIALGVIGVFLTAYGSPSKAAVDPAASPATARDPRAGILLDLKTHGTVDGMTEQEWREVYRQQVEKTRIQPRLDSGGEDCASATVIPALPYTDSGTTAGAVDNYNYFCPWEQSGSPDVVYQYTPSSNQAISVDLCESSYDTKLFVYAGTCTGDPIACNDDACGDIWGYAWASRIDCLPVASGVTYYIVVDGFFEFEYGDYVLHVDACNPCPNPPVHDVCENAKVVTSFPYTDTDNNLCAHHNCDNFEGIYADVWYKFTLTQPGDVTINFCGTDPAFYFAANSFMSCGGACTPVLVSDDEEYVTCPDYNPTLRWMNVPAGTYYYPVLSLWGSEQAYTININGPAPDRDDFSGFITQTDVRPTNRRYELTHESGEITSISFTGFCPGTWGQTVSHADSVWTVMVNGDGNDGDSIIFVASQPLTSGSIGTFVLRYPRCTSDIYWAVGSSSGVIPGSPFAPQSSLTVYQNSPNPFNPSTTIRFDLAEAAPVRLAIYDIMGREVAMLLNQMTEPGQHVLQFDAGYLTSGVYVCQVDVPGSQQRVKMLLVK